MIKTGFSLYLGSGFEKNKEVIKKASKANMNTVFTSLHIPEESVDDYGFEVKRLLAECVKHDLNVMVDVSNHTMEKLGIGRLVELKEWGFSHLRIDFGISLEEVVALSQDFYIVLNTSTITKPELEKLKELGADFSKFSSCHNFYPKPLTGISIGDCQKRNQLLKQYKIQTMGFVAGDLDTRGPLHVGLPTCEKHRYQPVLKSMLDLSMNGECDIVLIGDIDIRDETLQQLKDLSNGFINLRATIDPDYHYLTKMIHYDRVDKSEHLFRSVQSRKQFYKTPVKQTSERVIGSLCVSNENYLRYEGEFEIMKKDHPRDDRVNVVGQIIEEDIDYLSLIDHEIGIKLHLT